MAITGIAFIAMEMESTKCKSCWT